MLIEVLIQLNDIYILFHPFNKALSNYSGLFQSLFWIKLKRSIGVKGLMKHLLSDELGLCSRSLSLAIFCKTKSYLLLDYSLNTSRDKSLFNT